MFEEKYIIMETIGQRTQKLTSIVKDKKGKYYICKKVRVDDQKTMHEISLMRSLKHPNIISLHQIIQEKPFIHVIEEYCEEGDLEYHLKRQLKIKKKIDQRVISRWMLQILLALEYLHHAKIIHRDIKPKNIFLTSNGNIKLGSFRASKQLEVEMSYANTLINSSYYMTPELMEGKKYDCKVDLWAFGCVLYEICWLKPLINVSNLADLVNKLNNGKVEDLPTTYSKQLNIIYQKAMKKNPQQRVTAQELLKTDYFLQALQKFIADQGLNIALLQKIPIKKYKIHRYKYQRLKLKRGCNKVPSTQKKNNLLPCIQVHVNSIERKMSKGQSRQKVNITHTPIIKRSSLAKEYNEKKNASTEKKKIKTETYSKSKQKSDKQANIKKSTKKLEMNQFKKQSKYMLAPPLLPKPLKKIERTTTQKKLSPKKNANEDDDINESFEMTMDKGSLSKQLANFQKKDLKEVNENLNKMFQKWQIEEEEEVQFQFDEQNDLRLTKKQSKQEQASLLKTFKTKLQQLVDEINYKYCPDMQPITQKTTQFDSNSLSTFHPKFHC